MSTYSAYSRKLEHPKWQRKRISILDRDNYKCVYCNDEETQLHIHHKKYSGDPWEIEDEFLETVCRHCHTVISDIKKDYGETVSRIAKGKPVEVYLSGIPTFTMSVITEERYVHLFFWSGDSIVTHSIMSEEVVDSIHRILFPKPIKTRKRKNV